MIRWIAMLFRKNHRHDRSHEDLKQVETCMNELRQSAQRGNAALEHAKEAREKEYQASAGVAEMIHEVIRRTEFR